MIVKINKIHRGHPKRTFLWLTIPARSDILYLKSGFWSMWQGFYRVHQPHYYFVGDYVEVNTDEHDNVLNIKKIKRESETHVKEL